MKLTEKNIARVNKAIENATVTASMEYGMIMLANSVGIHEYDYLVSNDDKSCWMIDVDAMWEAALPALRFQLQSASVVFRPV